MKYVALLSLVLMLQACYSGSDKQYTVARATSEEKEITPPQPDPGQALLETYCYACHGPKATMETRLAPPMIAIKQHYMRSQPTKAEFTAAILDWVEAPSQEKSKMPGALRRFGVMPYQSFSKDTIVKISHYLYDNEIEKPTWFDEHHRGRMGRNKG